jgi:hypothetical protein
MTHVSDDSQGSSQTRRARRYEIVTPVRFRMKEGTWFEGTTVNIGAMGVLIRTTVPLPPSSPLELRIAVTGDPTSGAHIACCGRVLRSESIDGIGDVLIAVTIDRFQLRPPDTSGEDAGR